MTKAPVAEPLNASRALLYGLLHCWRHRHRLLLGAWPWLAAMFALLAASRLGPLWLPGWLAAYMPALLALLAWTAASGWLATARHAAAAPWQGSPLVWCRRWALWQALAVLTLSMALAWSAFAATRQGLACLAWALDLGAWRAAVSWLPHATGIAAAACCGRAALALACPSGFASGWQAGRGATASVSLALAAALALSATALLALRWLFVELNAWGLWEKSSDELFAMGPSALWREPVTAFMSVLRLAAFSLWLVFALSLSAAVAGRRYAHCAAPPQAGDATASVVGSQQSDRA